MSEEQQDQDAPKTEAATVPAVPLSLAVTPASEWRRRAKARYLLKLPSGCVVKARRPDWGKLIAQGIVDPDTMTRIMGVQDAAERTREVIGILPRLLPAFVEDPQIVDGPDAPDGSICSDDIMHIDMLALFYWSNGTNLLDVREQEIQ